MSDELTKFWNRISAKTGVPLDGLRFISDAFDCSTRLATEPNAEIPIHHRTAAEVCLCFVDFARETFGDDYKPALKSWNLDKSEKLGQVIFTLVDCNVWQKQDSDVQSDFDRQFDFSSVASESVPQRTFRYPQVLPQSSKARHRKSSVKRLVLSDATTWIFAIATAIAVAQYSNAVSAPLTVCVIVIGIKALRYLIPTPFRFSARTLLIATTLITVGLGLIVWAAK
jgi:uncharacterized repeat protein (TIGR04138 family)